MARLLLVLAMMLGGCKRATPPDAPPQIIEVRVVDKTPAGARQPIDVAALTRKAAEAVVKSSGLPVTDGGVAPENPGRRYRLRVEVRTEGVEDAQGGKGVMRALVTARLAPVGAEVGALSFEQSGVAERLYELAARGDLTAGWRAHTERLVTDVVGGVGARVRLASGDARALVGALDGADEDLREEATRLAAERKERATVPSLIKLLKSEDHDTRDRAIGALQAIGDARAVKPLTEVAHFRDLSDLPKILDALAAIGGAEARSYLEFVASGHDSVEIRDLAKQALTHLDQHAPHDLGHNP